MTFLVPNLLSPADGDSGPQIDIAIKAFSQSPVTTSGVGQVLSGHDIIQTSNYPLYATVEDFIAKVNPVGSYRRHITVVNGILDQPTYEVHGHHDLFLPNKGALQSTIANTYFKSSSGVFVPLDKSINYHRIYSGTNNYFEVTNGAHVTAVHTDGNIEVHKVLLST